MSTKYGAVLREEFVRANFLTGHLIPTRDLYMKVLPNGATDLPAFLLGFRLLAQHHMVWIGRSRSTSTTLPRC